MSGTLVYGAFSDYLEKAVLDHVFGPTPYARPAGLWLAVYTSAATETAGGAEPPGGAAYARQTVTLVAAPDLPDGSSAMWNSAVVQFPTATAMWGTLVGCGIHDAATGGNLLAFGTLVSSKVVDVGDAVRFGANQFVIGLQ